MENEYRGYLFFLWVCAAIAALTRLWRMNIEGILFIQYIYIYIYIERERERERERVSFFSHYFTRKLHTPRHGCKNHH
jgi:hypothetical protein